MLVRPRSRLWIVICAGALCYLPFINKPFSEDSDMLVHMARQMLVNPLNPPLGEYGRHMVLHDKTEMPVSSVFFRSPHPPLLPLSLVPVAAAAGTAEWPFHSAMFFFYCAALAAAWVLFGFAFRPRSQLLAAFVFAVSPALLLTAQDVMWDVPMAAIMLWCLVLMFKGLQKNSGRVFFVCGLLAGAGAVTKMSILPVYAVCTGFLIYKRKWAFCALWLVAALVLPCVWAVHNALVFGKVQYFSTGHFHPMLGDIRYRGERALGYLGGCVMFPVWGFWLAAREKRFRAKIMYAAAGTLLCLWCISLIIIAHKPFLMVLSYFFFGSLGLWLFMRSLVIIGKSESLSLTHDQRVLSIGFMVLYFTALAFLPTAGVRFIVPIVPFIIIAMVHGAGSFSPFEGRWFWGSGIVFGVIFSIGLCHADYIQARADKDLPVLLRQKGYSPARTWYFGRMAFDYYMFSNGFQNLKVDAHGNLAGDFLVHKTVPHDYDVLAMLPDGYDAKPVDTIQYSHFPLRTMPPLAGIHGNSRIPYALSFSFPQNEYVIFRIIEKSNGVCKISHE